MPARSTITLSVVALAAALFATLTSVGQPRTQAASGRIEPFTRGGDVDNLMVAERVSPPAPATTSPPRNLSPSGVSAPRGDLPGWKQLFVDDFATDVPLGSFPEAVSDRWDAYPSPWRDTSKNGQYTPERVVSIRNGVLNKHLHTENGIHMVSALRPKVADNPKYGTLYGRYEIRFRVDRKIPNYKVAWLLWPDVGTNITGSPSGIGGNGEIDFPEMDLDDDEVSAFVHYQDATRRDDQSWAGADVNIREWHTYTIEWSPNLVVFLLDGREIGRTTERVPNTSMHWVIQTETSLSTEPADGVRGNVLIDWVAMWGYDPSTR